jgi:CRISPR/Cas system-associated protein Csx1
MNSYAISTIKSEVFEEYEIILTNCYHDFVKFVIHKEDAEVFLKAMNNDMTHKQSHLRIVEHNGKEYYDYLGGDGAYSCLINKENIIFHDQTHGIDYSKFNLYLAITNKLRKTIKKICNELLN